MYKNFQTLPATDQVRIGLPFGASQIPIEGGQTRSGLPPGTANPRVPLGPMPGGLRFSSQNLFSQYLSSLFGRPSFLPPLAMPRTIFGQAPALTPTTTTPTPNTPGAIPDQSWFGWGNQN